jgi:hypothetical protein
MLTVLPSTTAGLLRVFLTVKPDATYVAMFVTFEYIIGAILNVTVSPPFNSIEGDVNV